MVGGGVVGFTMMKVLILKLVSSKIHIGKYLSDTWFSCGCICWHE